jgi:hypothetical protein
MPVPTRLRNGSYTYTLALTREVTIEARDGFVRDEVVDDEREPHFDLRSAEGPDGGPLSPRDIIELGETVRALWSEGK